MNPFADSHKLPFPSPPPATQSNLGWIVLTTIVGSTVAMGAVCTVFVTPSLSPFAIPVLGASIVCANLTGFWTGFGYRWVRFPLAALFICGASFVLSWITSGGEFYQFLFFYTGIVCTVGATGWLLRLFFGELKRVDANAISTDALQFDLRHLFILTTVVAIFVGVFQWMSNLEAMTHTFLIISVLIATISIATVVTIWAVFGQQITILRVVALVGVVVAAGGSVIFLTPGAGFFWSFIIIFEQAVTVSSLFCVRFQGYRFVKQDKALAT